MKRDYLIKIIHPFNGLSFTEYQSYVDPTTKRKFCLSLSGHANVSSHLFIKVSIHRYSLLSFSFQKSSLKIKLFRLYT